MFYPDKARINTVFSEVDDRASELVSLHFSKIKGRLIYAPDALAAAALYIACVEKNVKVSQRLISWLAGRTEVWLRDNYKKLWRELKLRDIEVLFEDNWKNTWLRSRRKEDD